MGTCPGRASSRSCSARVADLLFLALVDAHHAPAHVVVDGGGLPGLPDHGDHAEGAVGGDAQDVLPEAVGPTFSLLGEEPVLSP